MVETIRHLWANEGIIANIQFIDSVRLVFTSELAELWRKEVEAANIPFKIKIVEEGGTTVKSVVQKSNPRNKLGCAASDCMVCTKGKGEGGDCRRPNVGYEVRCDECIQNIVYIGETSKSGYLRGLDHLKNYRCRTNDSPLWKHALTDHQGRLDVRFSKKIIKTFRDPLTRQCNEAVRIKNSNADVLLNGKSEWHGPAIVRLTAEGGR